MKKIFNIIFVLLSLSVKAQVLNKNIVSTAGILGSELTRGKEALISFNDLQFGINIGNQSYPALRAIAINSSFDTSSLFYFQLSQFTYIKNIGFYDNHYYAITQRHSPTFPQSPFSYGPTGIAKIAQDGRLIWNRVVNPPNIAPDEFLTFGAVASTFDSSGRFWVLSNRRQGNLNQLLHPVLLSLDTSANVLLNTDIPCTVHSIGQHLFESDNNSIGIVGQEWRRDTATAVKWILNKNSGNQIAKFNFGINSERSSGITENPHRITQGPNGKYFFYGSSRKFNFHPLLYPFVNRGEFRDSSNTIISSFSLGKEWISYANYLKSGDLFCQVVTDSGFFLRWYNPNTGSLRQSVFEPVTDAIVGADLADVYLYPFISDSGNFYCATLCQGSNSLFFTRIYSLQNVGQVWSPWNNPTGLPSSKTALSLYAYPNPTSSRFKLRGYKEDEGLTLRLFNNSGKEVWRGVPSPEGEIDISYLSPGLYHVEALTSSGKRWSTRVVRE